jgi:hypothetical protein
MFASLVISSIGLALVGYGKKMARLPQLVVGLVLLVYPYFVPTLAPTLIVGGVLLGGLVIVLRLGW